VLVAGAVVAALLAVVSAVGSLAGPAYALDGYPVDAVGALHDEGHLGRNLLTDDAWAGWVIHEYGTDQPVFVDDRFDMYPVPVLEDFLVLVGAGPGWRAVLDRWDVETVVWEPGHPLVELLVADGWTEVHRDDLAVALVRPGL
jgi:hypothetical protein